jgi:hypothetical protein
MFQLEKHKIILIHSLGQFYVHKIYCSRDSSVGIVTGMLSFKSQQRDPGSHPAPYSMGAAVLSLAQRSLGATLTNRLH